jgi:Integrase core domain
VPPAAGLIHHSDRGSHYCAIDYQAELNKHGIPVSISGKGNCHDNAMVERFFKTLKSEPVWRTIFDTRQQADRAIGRYIDGVYNPLRRHSALDFTRPAQVEKHAAKSAIASPLKQGKSTIRQPLLRRCAFMGALKTGSLECSTSPPATISTAY